MAENIFDRIVIERVDLDITIGPKTFNLSGDKEFITLATRNKTDLFFLIKEYIKIDVSVLAGVLKFRC